MHTKVHNTSWLLYVTQPPPGGYTEQQVEGLHRVTEEMSSRERSDPTHVTRHPPPVTRHPPPVTDHRPPVTPTTGPPAAHHLSPVYKASLLSPLLPHLQLFQGEEQHLAEWRGLPSRGLEVRTPPAPLMTPSTPGCPAAPPPQVQEDR